MFSSKTILRHNRSSASCGTGGGWEQGGGWLELPSSSQRAAASATQLTLQWATIARSRAICIVLCCWEHLYLGVEARGGCAAAHMMRSTEWRLFVWGRDGEAGSGMNSLICSQVTQPYSHHCHHLADRKDDMITIREDPFRLMTPKENDQSDHIQAWSPRVAKGRQGSPRVKGDPRVGWDELEPNRSYLSHFPTWYSKYSKSGHFPIEIPIKNEKWTKKLLTPLNHSDFQKLKCFLK